MAVKTSLIIAVALVVATAINAKPTNTVPLLSDDEVEREFSAFVARYQRKYASLEEVRLRRSIFADNLQFIREFPASRPDATFTVGINAFADMTAQEFAALLPRRGDPVAACSSEATPSEAPVPSSKDWRKSGCIPPVHNMGQCAAANDYVVADVAQAYKCIETGQNVTLSVQELIDCVSGCRGSFLDDVFKFCQEKGIDTEASYPTHGSPGPCKADQGTVGAKCGPIERIPAGNETALTQVLGTHGPVVCGIDASSSAFQLYTAGVFSDKNCGTSIDHVVLTVGYGATSDGTDYYIVKNSWGVSWGMQGYILIARNDNNMCGIASEAVYPSKVTVV